MFTALQKKAIVTMIFCLWNLSNLNAMEQDRGYKRLIVTAPSHFHKNHYSHLQRACLDGDEKIVEQEIQQKYWDVKTTITTYDRKYLKKIPTSLHLAAQKGHGGIIEKLFNAKADINSTHCDCDNTPLHTAVWYKKPNSVETLMQHGANPLIPNCHDSTPAHFAACNDNVSCLEKLFTSNNIQRNLMLCTAKNKTGQTPLDIAAITGSTNVSQGLQATICATIWFCAYLELVSEYAHLLEEYIV